MSKIKPNHYLKGDIDLIEGLYYLMPRSDFRGFMMGNIMKYVMRYQYKNGLEDLDKATEYIRRLRSYEEMEDVKNNTMFDAVREFVDHVPQQEG